MPTPAELLRSSCQLRRNPFRLPAPVVYRQPADAPVEAALHAGEAVYSGHGATVAPTDTDAVRMPPPPLDAPLLVEDATKPFLMEEAVSPSRDATAACVKEVPLPTGAQGVQVSLWVLYTKLRVGRDTDAMKRTRASRISHDIVAAVVRRWPSLVKWARLRGLVPVWVRAAAHNVNAAMQIFFEYRHDAAHAAGDADLAEQLCDLLQRQQVLAGVEASEGKAVGARPWQKDGCIADPAFWELPGNRDKVAPAIASGSPAVGITMSERTSH